MRWEGGRGILNSMKAMEDCIRGSGKIVNKREKGGWDNGKKK